MNAVPSLLSLLNHENVDIVVDVIALLNEMVDSDGQHEGEPLRGQQLRS